MSSRQSYVVIGVLALVALASMAVANGLQWIFVYAGWDNFPLFGLRQFVITNVITSVFAVVAAVVALRHPVPAQLSVEVVDELTKVTWPSREETSSATKVVIVTVIICAVFLGSFDAVWLALTNWMLGVEG